MAVPPIVLGAILVTIVTTIAGLCALKSKSERADNSGEIVNTIKVILPDNTENTFIMYGMLAVAAAFTIIYLVKCCKKSQRNEVDLMDLENPRMPK